MKILMLINWEIKYYETVPQNQQPSDYFCNDEPFWFFKYFNNIPNVDVCDISAPLLIKKIEKLLRFHLFQTFKVLSKLKEYDLIFIHGTNSAMLLCALKRLFKFKTPPILVVDISSFHQARKSGMVHRLARFASKCFDYLTYHTSSQIDYYSEEFPWLVKKSCFIPVGVDYDYWNKKEYIIDKENDYIICVGYRKRDWTTLINAYKKSNIQKKLYLIGNSKIQDTDPNIKVVPFVPIDRLMNYIINSSYSVIPLDNFNYSFGQLTLLQQMSVGVPIIAADVPAIRDYAKESNGVVLYEAYNVDSLCGKLCEMENLSKQEFEKMKEANTSAIKNILSEKNMSIEFEKVCELLLCFEGNMKSK